MTYDYVQAQISKVTGEINFSSFTQKALVNQWYVNISIPYSARIVFSGRYYDEVILTKVIIEPGLLILNTKENMQKKKKTILESAANQFLIFWVRYWLASLNEQFPVDLLP